MFNKFNLSQDVLRALESKGFVKPTEIQDMTIPVIMEGRDVFGRSKTGSGKTLAYALPAIELIDMGMDRNQILIICPTRELAMQVGEEFQKMLEFRGDCGIVCVYGGANINNQITKIKTAKVVIGTPGRLMDHMRRRTLKLDKIKMVVLDEADEMLNMGFRDDIETILKRVPTERQTVMFSATMPRAIKNITTLYMRDPKYIEIGELNSTLEEIEQTYVRTTPYGKRQALLELFAKLAPERSIVFCNTKIETDQIMNLLNDNGYKSVALHGDMKQNERNRVMASIKAHKIPTLIATDVASRGIDIDDLDYIFNYDLPNDVEQYIHRIGRTGRAGKSGKAITIINSKDEFLLLKDYITATKADINEHSLSETLSTFKDIDGIKPPAKSVMHGRTQYISKTGAFLPFTKRTRW